MMAADSQAEIAASVGALKDLGPGYDQALAEGLVERIGAEIDKRIAAEIDNRVTAEVDSRILTQLDRYAGCRLVALPVTAIVLRGSPGFAALLLMALIWVIVGAINVAYALRKHPHATETSRPGR
jgi:hypothetical protein